MRVCMLSKFPPIQGGIAARTYWLARGLGEAGIEVEIITNANCVEPEYRISGCDGHLERMKNVRIHNLREDVPWHIPFSDAYVARLLNATLKVLALGNIDAIDAGFLMPYGVVAFLASQITGVPYVVRHGGSDLAKFVDHPEFSIVLGQVLRNASKIITDETHAEQFNDINKNIHLAPAYVANEHEFTPNGRSRNERPVIAYIGKVNYHWRNKRLDEALTYIAKQFDDYRLVFVAQGKGLHDFRQAVGEQKVGEIEFRNFAPPWEMPSLISSIDYVLTCEDAIKSPSNIVAEVVSSGRELLSVPGALISGPKSDRSFPPRQESHFDSWIDKNINVLASVSN